MKALIVALKYLEPEYEQTLKCLADYGGPYVPCDRNGVGNMAKAYNDGFRTAMGDPQFQEIEYVWFISNITFKPWTLPYLIDAMDRSGLSAMCPVYDSDHKHLRPTSFHAGQEIAEVPFVEFTCPIVRVDVFKDFLLDEKLPYYYHDLDWSHRVKLAGHRVGVHRGVEVGHVYLRNSTSRHPVTLERIKRRNQATPASKEHMRQKWGRNWEKLVWPR